MADNAEALTAGTALGIGAAALGIVTAVPIVAVSGVVLSISGVFCLIGELSSSKFNKIFESCGLVKDGAYPKIIEKKSNYLICSIPRGLGFNTFYSKKDELEAALGSMLEIKKYGSSSVKIQKIESDELSYTWHPIWEACGLCKSDEYPRLLKNEETSSGDKFEFSIPLGFSEEDFYKKQDVIEAALKKRVRLEMDKNYRINIVTFKDKLKKLYKFKLELLPKQIMQFAAGMAHTLQGEASQVIDLNTSDCHMGVFGATGSGKSAFVKMLITQAILQDIELKIIDLKGGVETKMFSRYKNCTDYTIFPDDASEILGNVHQIMYQRYAQLNKSNCKDYKDYNKKHNGAMKPIILLIEEYSLLFANKDVTELLFLLLNLARAANISVILTLQRPDHKTLDTRIKSNLRTLVCFKYKQDIDSEIVLGRGDFTASKGLKNTPVGRGILNTDTHDNMEFQSYYLEDKEILKLISSKLTKKAVMSTLDNVVDLGQKREEKKATQEDVKNIDLL